MEEIKGKATPIQVLTALAKAKKRVKLVKQETLNKAIDIAKLSASLKESIKVKKQRKRMNPIDKLFKNK